MSFDHDERYSYVDRGSELDLDNYSELGPDDSASQIGRAITTTEDSRNTPRFAGHTADGLALQWVNTTEPHAAPTSPRIHPRIPEYPITPPSRRTSIRSSRLLSPTTLVPSRQDKVRYSWQSIQTDEPNRPRIHIIKIISNTATASAGLPGGEPFGFSISPGGRRIACYNSARLFILQAAALPVNISQEYSLKRRPLAVEVVDEGWIVAILTDEHTINVYDLSHHRVRRLKTFKPDYPTTTIALSPTGALLAAAYENAVEVFSLDPNALSTDRRAARSARMDRLQFSDDGSTLIGTTTRLNAASTVFMSVPLFPAATNGIPTHEELKEAWCTNILEPVNILDSSHASFFREKGKVNNEKLFAWNGVEDTFGLLSTQDLEYNNVDFPVMISPPLSTCGGLGAAIHSVPTLDERGDTVAMVVNDRTIRLYSVPHSDDDAIKIEAHSVDHELDGDFGCPFSDIRWVHSSTNLPAPKGDPTQVSGRLVIVSPGGVVDPTIADEIVDDVEGGRIIMFDFDPQYAGQPGQTFTFTLGKAPPQTLDEQEMDVAQEVALVRRRTVTANQKVTQRATTLGRAASTVNRNRLDSPQEGTWDQSNGESLPQSPIERLAPNSFARSRGLPSELSYSWEVLPGLAETNEVIEEPFDGNNPRSVITLQRAASAANSHRIQTYEEQQAERQGARTNGGVPLPQYTEEPNTPLPGRYRALAGLEQPREMGKSASTPRLTDPSSSQSAMGSLASAPSLDALVSRPSAATLDRNVAPQRAQNWSTSYESTSPAPAGPTQRVHDDGVSPVGASSPRTPSVPGQEWENTASPMHRADQALVSPLIGFRSPRSNISHESAVSPIIGGSSSPRRPNFQADNNKEQDKQESEPRGVRERFYREVYEREKRERAEREVERFRLELERDHERDRERAREHSDGLGRFESRINAHHAAAMQQVQQAQQAQKNQTSHSASRPQQGLYAPQTQQQPLSPISPSFAEASQRASHSNFAPVPVSPNDPYPSASEVSRDTSMLTTSDVMQPGIGRSRSMHNPSTRKNHLPPHLVAMQDRFHSSSAHSTSSSLFPLDRRYSIQPNGGSVGHKITGWYPPAASTSRMSSSSGRPSSAPPDPNSDSSKKKKWFSGRKTPTRKYLDDGTWMIEEGRKCIVM